MKAKLTDWIMERLVWIAGLLVLTIVGAIFFYLSSESRYAFDRTFAFGYRIALQPTSADPKEDIAFDPNATFVGAHLDGVDGLDEKEETIPMPSIDQMRGASLMATGVGMPLPGAKAGDPPFYTRDDWRAPKTATASEKFTIYGYASPEQKNSTMRLRWGADSGFIASRSPYRLNLRLVRAPAGVNAPKVEIDLVEQPSGSLDLPTWIAKTDDDRTKGYVFELTSTPRYGSNFLATVSGLMSTDWEPTHPYARYGFMPLLLGTLLITLIAVCLAAPVAVLTSLYLSELAPSRLREWLKAFIELLASVPTVVLGYFGLMLVAPGLIKVFGEAAGMTSGRSLLTASLLMAVLILPLMISVAEDALRAVPSSLRDGAFSLGFSPAEAIRKVLLPAARPGIIAALLLGFARAIGETMIVWILAGGTATMASLADPIKSLVQPSRGIADTIAIEMGNVVFEAPHYGHLFLIGLILFVLTLAINLTGYYYGRRAWRV